MYATYGGYQFDDNALSFVFTERALLDASGVPYAYNPQYRCSYRVEVPDTGNQATDQAALTVKLDTLRNALKNSFQDFKFFDNSGALTHHRLLNSDTIGGVKVLELPAFPVSMGAEYSTFRNLEFVIGAEVTAPTAGGGGQNPILRWSESLTFIGSGGPRWVSQTMVEGPPRGDQTAQQTSIRAIQEGAAIGYTRYIDFPPPLYPANFEHGELRVRRKQSAQKWVNGVETELPSNWQYHFEFNGEQALVAPARPTYG